MWTFFFGFPKMEYRPPQQPMQASRGTIGQVWSKRRGARGLTAALCLWLPLLSSADVAPDQAIVSLKSATLDLMQAQAAAPEAPGSFSIYVGNKEPSLLLDEIQVWIDNAAPQRYEFSDREARALHRNGLHRLLLVSLVPGMHHFRADFAARYADAPPDHLRVAGVLERSVSTTAQPAMLELELVKGSLIGKPDLQFHQLQPAAGSGAAPDSFVPGSADDPRLRAAAFLTDTDRPLAAAAALFLLRAQNPGMVLSADYSLRLADALNAFGLSQRAQSLYQQAGGSLPADGATAQSYADYNRGVALLRDGSIAEGGAQLAAVASGKGDDEEAAALRDKANLTLGYMQLRNHTGANAVALFSSVRSFGADANAALLGLGWALLAPSGNGQNAGPPHSSDPQAPLQRIPVLLQPTLTGDIATLRRHQPYSLKQASPQEEQAVRRALVPWLELIGRDPLDPAVQEGMIAIPYALNHIGAYQEAEDRFMRAVKLLEAADAQLDAAMQRVNAGQMIQALDTRDAAGNGWPWWLAAYPKEHWWLADDPRDPMAAPDTFYIQHLMAGDSFHAALWDFHDLRLLDDAIESMQGAAGADNLRARVAAATTGQGKLLQDLALAELQQEKRHTRMYLGEARFALAHMNELPPPPTAAVAVRPAPAGALPGAMR